MQKQNLSQKMLQKLSPQQIQLMKLLQIPTVMLEQRIQEELEGNPALELEENMNDSKDSDDNDIQNDKDDDYYDEESYIIGTDGKKEKIDGDAEDFDNYDNSDTDFNDSEDFESTTEDLTPKEKFDEFESFEDQYTEKEDSYLEEYLEEYLNDDTASYKLEAGNYNEDQEDSSMPVAVESSFGEYLESQLGMLELSPDEEIIARQIIGNIDEDGYLRREPISMVDDLLFTENLKVRESDVTGVLNIIVQRLDPPGVGAQTLQECLLIQLERKILSQDVIDNYTRAEKKNLKLAISIIKDYFDEFSKKHYNKLLRQLNLFNDDLKAITDEILKLNPKPGSAFAPSQKIRKYIMPDFIVENKDGVLELSLNTKNAPELRINDQYRNMLEAYSNNKKDKKQKEAALFVKQKIDAARWFIDAIKQRQETMFKTMYTILTFQEDFFMSGDEKKLKPMILKDIAEITGLDISTVSRVANSKYVQTEFGTRLLKEFFSEAMQTDSGEEVSTLEVKKILTEIISAEDKRKPQSDENLMNILIKRGYNIARRTVAKYREQLGIPVARLRKEL
jgi:RNA polymerase sigma-54 factor